MKTPRGPLWQWLAGLMLLVAGCTFDPRLKEGSVVTCANDTECPSGHRCSLRLGHCVSTTGDSDPPGLVDAKIAPGVVAKNGSVELRFTTTEKILGEPVLSLTGVVLSERVATENGETFLYTLAVSDAQVEGLTEVSVSLADFSGNEATLKLGQVTFDFTPPQAVQAGIELQPLAARPGQGVIVQIPFTEVLGAAPTLTLMTSGQPLTAQLIRSEGALATFQVTVPSTEADGELALTLGPLVDLAGNRSGTSSAGQLRVDTRPPQLLSVGIKNGIVVRSAQSGFSDFTVVAQAAAGAGDSTRTEVRFFGTPMSCREVAVGTVECDGTVDATMAEGDAPIEVLVTDTAGNLTVGSTRIRIDLTAPAVAAGTLQQALFPGLVAALPQVTALGEGARDVVTFTTTEPVSVSSGSINGQPLFCMGSLSSLSCTYTHECALGGDGTWPVLLTLVDQAGNRFEGPSGATVQTDCTAPVVSVDVPGWVRWHRAPFGADWSPSAVGSRLEVAVNAVNEPAVVRLGNAVSATQVAQVASAAYRPDTALVINVVDRADRASISVQAIDGAGNASPPQVVRDNVASIQVNGPVATANAPGFFRSELNSNSITPTVETMVTTGQTSWSQPTTPVTVPPVGVDSFISLSNNRMLSYSTQQVLLYDLGTGTWERGTPPPRIYLSPLVVLKNGTLLLTGSPTGLLADNEWWLFDADAGTWAQLPIANLDISADSIVPIGEDRFVIYGRDRRVTPVDMRTWLLDVPRRSVRRIISPMSPAGYSALAPLPNGRVLLTNTSHSNTTGWYTNDNWVLDTNTDTWSKLPATQPTVARAGASLMALPDGTVLMVGGDTRYLSPYYNVPATDSWLFNPANNTWSAVSGASPSKFAYRFPLARLGALNIMALGDTDTWLFDIGSKQWRRVPGVPPSPGSLTLNSTGQPVWLSTVQGYAFLWGPTPYTFDLFENRWAPTISNAGQKTARAQSPMVTLSNGKVLASTGRVRSANNTLVASSDRLLFERTSNSWVDVTDAGVAPPSRIGAAMVSLPGAKALLFGGSSTSSATSPATALAQPQVYDEAAGLWVATANAPPARFNFGMTRLQNGTALVFGGASSGTENAPAGSLSDTWLFTVGTNSWSQVNAVGPSARFDHQLTALSDGRALLFGGMNGATALGDTWLYDAVNTSWSQVTVGPQPFARRGHAMTRLGSGKVLMLGGWNGTDCWLFNPVSNTWSQLQGTLPEARSGHQLVTLSNGNAFLFGGYRPDETPLGDGWVFDSSSEQWVQVTSTLPSPRLFHSMVALPNNAVLVLGGRSSFDNNTLNNANLSYLGDWAVIDFKSQTTLVASIELASLGVEASRVTRLDAQATAGADGFDVTDSMPVNGVELQLYRTSGLGAVFQTLASNAAPSASPQSLMCSGANFLGSSTVAMRLKPVGVSQGRAVSINATSAALDVFYSVGP